MNPPVQRSHHYKPCCVILNYFLQIRRQVFPGVFAEDIIGNLQQGLCHSFLFDAIDVQVLKLFQQERRCEFPPLCFRLRHCKEGCCTQIFWQKKCLTNRSTKGFLTCKVLNSRAQNQCAPSSALSYSFFEQENAEDLGSCLVPRPVRFLVGLLFPAEYSDICRNKCGKT